MKLIKPTAAIQWMFRQMGLRITRAPRLNNPLPWDMDEEFQAIFEKSAKFSMTSTANRYSLYQAIKYLVKHDIPGDIVECGVWRGGSTMVAASTLLALGDTKRRIWLYDTFEGSTEPGDIDVRAYDGAKAKKIWKDWNDSHEEKWISSPLEDVKRNMVSTGYPEDKFMYIQGMVEDTIPNTTPDAIALLRLDTDWYQSTYHELNNLFPIVSKNGVLIIDDYGWWKGSKEATDQYFNKLNVPVYLNRVDVSCRLVVKTN